MQARGIYTHTYIYIYNIHVCVCVFAGSMGRPVPQWYGPLASVLVKRGAPGPSNPPDGMVWLSTAGMSQIEATRKKAIITKNLYPNHNIL